MSARLRRPDPLSLGVLLLLGGWVLIPALILVARPLVHGGVFTGVTGIDPIDEFQYLAWIRDSGVHGLAANLFGLSGGGHVFLQPMWFLSGVLWRIGVGLQLSYLLWIPVAVLVLWVGFDRFAIRHASTPGRRLAILVLGLFFATPLGWLDLPLTHWLAEMQLAMSDATVALQPWFALHTALALGLMALVLLGAERLTDTVDGGLRAAAGPALGALAVSWLHSWQGEALLLTLGGVVLLNPHRVRRARALAPVFLGALLPLAYQLVLTRTDAAWKIIEQTNDRPDLIVLTPQLAVLGPLLLVAVAGLIRRPPRDAGEQMLVLWPLGAVLVYRFNHEFPPHALQGVALPLAALAVRGWPRGRTAAALGSLGVAAFTLPGLAYFAKALPPTVQGNRTLFFQDASEHAALTYLAEAPGAGPVLAPYPLALEVPAFTDRAVWDGHQAWTPDAAQRDAQADALFAGQMHGAAVSTLLRAARVRWLLIDCDSPPSVRRELAPLASVVHRSGCALVVRLR
jgi:hypothetical protein